MRWRVKDTALTKPQLAAYWRAATAAAREVGEPLETYRKRVMREECGVESVKALSRTGDFDKVMLRFSVDAGDYGAAGKFATAGAERMSRLVCICAAQIMQLKGAPSGSTAAADYLAGVIRQARFPCGSDAAGFWLDCPADDLMALFHILDTHRRRLLRRLCDSSSIRRFLSFDPSVVYGLKPSGGISIVYDSKAYSDLNSIRLNVR